MTLGGIVGGLFGGYLSSRLKLSLRGLLKFLLASTVLALIANVVALFFGCPQLTFAGSTNSNPESISR